jgi:hypothetical protein
LLKEAICLGELSFDVEVHHDLHRFIAGTSDHGNRYLPSFAGLIAPAQDWRTAGIRQLLLDVSRRPDGNPNRIVGLPEQRRWLRYRNAKFRCTFICGCETTLRASNVSSITSITPPDFMGLQQ